MPGSTTPPPPASNATLDLPAPQAGARAASGRPAAPAAPPSRPGLATRASPPALGLLVAAGGLWGVAPGVPAGPRFWATVFFVLLLWPMGLTLLGRMAGLWVQRGAVAALLLAAAGQQVANGALPLPEHVRWHA